MNRTSKHPEVSMEDGAGASEPRTARGLLFARGVAELLVIIVGVVIGLGVDRWMAGIDEGTQAERLSERLLADVRADSAQLEALLRTYGTVADELLGVLEVLADPQATIDDPTDFIRVIEVSSWWIPLNASKSTWEEINSTGQLRLFEPRLRSSLAVYYESLAQFGEIEARWVPAFQEYWNLQQPVLPPLLRIVAVDQGGGGPMGREVTPDEAAQVLAAFRENDALHGALGRLASIFRYGPPAIQRVSAAANVAIEALESR